MNGVIPNKNLGQHWLHDGDVLDAIIQGAGISSNDTVIEIGPGLGTLTKRLLKTGARVIAIEFDESLLDGLKKTFVSNDRFKLVHADVRRFNFEELPSGYKIVANIPYYLTSQLLRILSELHNKPVSADLLLQKEVTDRVCAKAPNMSILAVAVQSVYRAKSGVFVPAQLFTPPPKVDSLILHLEERKEPLVDLAERKAFMRIVKAGFSAKRKTLRNTLSAGLQISKNEAESILRAALIDPDRRAESLTLNEWHTVYRQYLTC